MKRALFLTALALLLTGCVTAAPKRGMLDDHTWYSEAYPDLQVRVSDKLAYRKADSYYQYRHQFYGKDRAVLINFKKNTSNPQQVDYWNHLYHVFTFDKVISHGDYMVADRKGYFWDYVYCTEDDDCFLTRHIACYSANHDLFTARYGILLLNSEKDEWKTGEIISQRQRELYNTFVEDFNRDVTITRYSGPKQGN